MSITICISRDGAILWLWGAMAPPKFWKIREYIYRLLTDLSNFAHIKLDLPPPPPNKIFDPFKQNEKAQETFTNLKSQTKQISKPKKLAQQHRLIKKLKKF